MYMILYLREVPKICPRDRYRTIARTRATSDAGPAQAELHAGTLARWHAGTLARWHAGTLAHGLSIGAGYRTAALLQVGLLAAPATTTMRTCSLLLVVALLPRCCAALLRGARFRPGANNTTEWSGPEVRVVRQENGAVAWQIDGHQNVQPQFFKVALTHDPHAKDNWTDVDYELQLACKAAVPVVSFLINEANVSKYGNTEAGSSWSLFSRSFDASTEAMFARVERICPDAYLWPNIDAWLPPTSCGTPLDNVTLRVSTTGSDYVDYSNFNNAPNSAWLDCASSHLSSFMALLDGRFPGKIWGVHLGPLKP
jgi:hypothetical protein